jgi:competence protein ComEA
MHYSLKALLTILALLALARTARAEATTPVDLNTASMEQLMQLPGLGPKRAEEIVRRRLIAPFRRTSDLMRIKGIGKRTYLKLRTLVRVGPAPVASSVGAVASP